MKEINAYWEKRNIGKNTYEVIFELNDNIDIFVDKLNKLNSPYQVLKIPSGRVDMLLHAQKMGFEVIETSIHLLKKVKDYQLPNIYKRFEPVIKIKEANETQIARVLSEIKSGVIFATDRIALDPNFSTKISGNRYYNWTKDLIENGAKLNIAIYNDEEVGFSVNKKESGNTYNAVLGGVFSDFASKGIGFLAIHSNMTSIVAQGGTKVITSVSSNNLPILRLHMLFGFEIHSMEYVLIKHKEVSDYVTR